MSRSGFIRWETLWLVDTRQGDRKVPAFDFLREQDDGPRKTLLQIVEAVKGIGGPDNWRDAHMHARMEGDLDDLHEARDKHGETLYRLFLLWQRDKARVWMIDGRTKAVQTTLKASEYRKIRELANLILEEDPPPAATVDDFAQTLLR